MAKFYGNIGFAKSVDKGNGIWGDEWVVKPYYGDILRNNRRLQSSDQLTENINISNEITILSDPYANENFFNMKYIELHGAKWEVTTVEVIYPRLKLSIGGLYNA